MAGGAVRELITKIKFQIDQASLSQVNKTLKDVKKSLASVSDKSLKVGATAETSKAQSALKDLKRQADNVATKTSNIKIGAEISKAQNALKDVKNQANNVSATTLKVKTGVETSNASSALKNLKAQADNVAATTSSIKIGADVSNANAALKGIKNNIASVGKEKSVTISADTVKTENALKNVKASFDGISKDKKILVDANTAKANEKLKNLKAQADNVSATTSNIKIGADVSNANAALKGIKNNIASVGKEKSVTISADTDKTENALKNVKASFDGISKDKKILFDANTDKANAKLNKLKTTLDAVKAKKTNVKVNADTGKATSALQRLKRTLNDIKANVNAKVNVDSGNANSALARIKGQLNSLSGKVTTAYVEVKQKGKAVGEGVKKTGQALADNGGTIAATGAAMVAPLALPVNTAMDFEAAMSKVKAITNGTDEDMKRLTQTARDLGKSTQYSASEAAQAMSYLGMAGWKTEQIIAGMPGLLDLAAASGEDLARVADIVSDDLTAFKMPAEQAAHMADVMAAASTNANTNVSMMGETFKYAGAIAGSLGYSLEDVAAAAGLMANAGIKSEMAGTALRSIMTRMIKPPKEAAAALDQLGVSATNADGTVKPFREQMIALRNAMKGLTDAQKAEMANSIAGQEAMSGFLAVINASDADFAKMTNAVDNADGAAAKMAATMNDNAKGALKALKSALEDVAITIGNAFLGSLGDATKGLTNFIRKIGDFAKEHPKIVAGITAFIAAAGALLVILGGIGLAISAITPVIGALGGVFAAVSGAVGSFMAIFASWGSVFGALFGGIVSLASGAFATLTGFFGSFIAGISSLLSGGLIGVLTGAFRGAVSLIMGLFSPINVAIMAVIGVILLLKDHWDEVVAWFAPGIESMEEGLAQLASAWANIAPIVDALMPLFQNVALMLGSVIVGAVSFLWRAFSAAFNMIAGVINWVTGLLNDLAGTIRWVADGINGLIDKAKAFIGLKGDISAVNTSITQKWADKAMGGGGNSTTQNNTFNFTNPNQYAPVASNLGLGVTDFS